MASQTHRKLIFGPFNVQVKFTTRSILLSEQTLPVSIVKNKKPRVTEKMIDSVIAQRAVSVICQLSLFTLSSQRQLLRC